MNEREILLNTNYHNLNKLVTTTKNADWLCLILEPAEGVDLVSLLRSYKRLPEDVVKLIILQLTYTFEYFRSHSIIYKDLKASHVFLTPNLRVELLDLGLAEQISDGL